MVRGIPFGKLQKIWAVIRGDAIFLLFEVSLADVDIFYNNSLSRNLAFIEDITRWREDMNFMFEWREQYLTSERSELVRYIVLATRT